MTQQEASELDGGGGLIRAVCSHGPGLDISLALALSLSLYYWPWRVCLYAVLGLSSLVCRLVVLLRPRSHKHCEYAPQPPS